jgi:hypothetical protein
MGLWPRGNNSARFIAPGRSFCRSRTFGSAVNLGELGLQFPTPSFPVPRMDRRPLHLLTLSHIFQVLAWTSLALALALAISAYVVLAPLL